MGEKEASTSWSKWFEHLEWICYLEDARPFVWLCVVYLVKGTLYQEKKQQKKQENQNPNETFGGTKTFSTLVDVYNFEFVLNLLLKFVQPAMVDAFHAIRPTSQSLPEGNVLPQTRRAKSRSLHPSTLLNTESQSIVALSLTQFMFTDLARNSENENNDPNQNETAKSPKNSNLNSNLNGMEHKNSTDRTDHWLLLLNVYKNLYYNDIGRPELCKEAQRLLEDVLLGHCVIDGQTIVLPHQVWTRCFNEIIFPLVGIGPSHVAYGTSPHMRMVTLLSRTVLHNFEKISTLNEFYELWLTLIGILTTLVRRPSNGNGNGNEDSMEGSMGSHLDTTARESLKNLILVAHHSGLLENEKKNNLDTRDVWGPTWALVGSVSLPLCQEIERATRPPSPILKANVSHVAVVAEMPVEKLTTQASLPSQQVVHQQQQMAFNNNAVFASSPTVASTFFTTEQQQQNPSHQHISAVPTMNFPTATPTTPTMPTLPTKPATLTTPTTTPTTTTSTSIMAMQGEKSNNGLTTSTLTTPSIPSFSSQEIASREQQPPLLELDIKVPSGEKAKLIVFPGDSAEEVAQTFALRHGLQLDKKEKLCKVIKASLRMYAAKSQTPG